MILFYNILLILHFIYIPVADKFEWTMLKRYLSHDLFRAINNFKFKDIPYNIILKCKEIKLKETDHKLFFLLSEWTDVLFTFFIGNLSMYFN